MFFEARLQTFLFQIPTECLTVLPGSEQKDLWVSPDKHFTDGTKANMVFSWAAYLVWVLIVEKTFPTGCPDHDSGFFCWWWWWVFSLFLFFFPFQLWKVILLRIEIFLHQEWLLWLCKAIKTALQKCWFATVIILIQSGRLPWFYII